MIVLAKKVNVSPSYKTDTFVVAGPISNSFTLTFTPLSESIIVFLSGTGMTEGATVDFTLSGNILTIDASHVLAIGDRVTAIYPH